MRLVLATATLVPIAVLAWLGVRILDQDRIVEQQRNRELLEVESGRLALGLERRFNDIEEQLSRGAGLRFTSLGIDAPAEQSLLFQPVSSAGNPLKRFAAIDAAETREFQQQDFVAAESAYRRLAESNDPNLRAAALVRLGRVLREEGRDTAALDAYRTLERLGATDVEGQPAALIARQGMARLFEEKGAKEDLQTQAKDLARTLSAGGWHIDRATFELYRDLLQQWGASLVSTPAIARTEAAIQLWESWRQGNLPSRGRRVIRGENDAAVVAVWSSSGSPEQPVVWLATADQMEALILPLAGAAGLTAALSDTDGQTILGLPQHGAISLAPGETRFPFVLHVAYSQTSARRGSAYLPRNVLICGLLVAFLLMIAAAAALYRVTTRELMLARQQSDFVSSVSHEFRTPLTSMRHLTELLVTGNITSDERKAQYYELLANETERLHRMVEALLSFGRIEVGAYAWHLEPADPGELVRNVVDDFRRDPQAAARSVTCNIDDRLPSVAVDREALTRALWNLLENAAKYSDVDRPIRVFAKRSEDALLIGVEDEGHGIPASEREKIFHKFVRGSDAKRAGIRGVGIGLALVQHIAEAHGGSVQLESELGSGSRFTLVIPCPES